MSLKTGGLTHAGCSEGPCSLSPKCLVCQSGEQFQNEGQGRSPQERTPLFQGVRGLMGRAQTGQREEKRDSLQNPVPRGKELVSGLLEWIR